MQNNCCNLRFRISMSKTRDLKMN